MTNKKAGAYSAIEFALLFLFGLLIFSAASYAEKPNIKTLQKEIKQLKQQIRTNENDLTKQKSLLENNSVKLYETLIKLDEVSDKSIKYSDTLKTHGGQFESIDSRLNREYEKKVLDTVNISGFWLFIAALLVFLMPIGFIAYESGQINRAAMNAAGMKHLLTWNMIFLVYFIVGFGMMYGESRSGLVGSSLIFLASPDLTTFFGRELEHVASPTGFLFYQLGFAITAGLIVASALNKHLSMTAYGFIAFCIGGLVYPVFGHWAWSSHLSSENQGWLEGIGFKDFAGATVIHSLAAWFALVWARGLKVNPVTLKTEVGNPAMALPNPLVYSVIGVFILWFGWIGLIAGNHLQYDIEIVELVLKTSLAGVSAGLAAALASIFGGGMKTLGSVLSGFVAISAACDVVAPLEAIIIGSVAGLLYPLACALLKITILRGSGQGKTIGVIAAHGVCGIWGTLCVALFGTEGLLSTPDKAQLMIQLKGVVVAFGFSILSAYICLSLYRAFSGLVGDRNDHQEKQTASAS